MPRISLDALLTPDYMIPRVIEIHRAIRRYINQRPDLAFEIEWFRTDEGNKYLLSVDRYAERLFMDVLMTNFGTDNIFVIGEESLLKKKVDLSNETRISVLLDMIDGTDLLQRGFSNWCSAIIIFQPNKKKIRGAFVAIPSVPSSYIYYATADRKGAYKRRLSETSEDKEIPLAGSSKSRTLKDASICMHAQKSKNLLALLSLNNNKKFVNWLNEIEKTEQKSKDNANSESISFRFYNLAGNPMMVKLGDGIVDVVLDLNGQAPHDVVPGAFIAIKAGAILGKVTGEEFTLEELSKYLLRPSKSRIRYILAANESLLEEISDLLSDDLQ